MDIRHEKRGEAGAFVAGEGSERAELTYRPAAGGSTVVFDHTYVPSSLRGRGIAEALVERGAQWAREEGRRVVPSCSYVRTLFQRHPERYADVTAESTRPFGGA